MNVFTNAVYIIIGKNLSHVSLKFSKENLPQAVFFKYKSLKWTEALG